MTNFIKRTWAEINLNNIEHNYKEIRKNVDEKVKICCVVKADGYGHGAVAVAKEYEKLNADFFAVSNIEEALELRYADIKKPILVLGYTPPRYAKLLNDMDISQTVYSLEYAKLLSSQAKKENINIKIHLKIDTGMSRIGVMCQDIEHINASLDEAYKIATLENFEREGIYTHFSSSDEVQGVENFTTIQYERFINIIQMLSKKGVDFKIRHTANSGAIINYKDMHLDMVRAGIILYGLSPCENQSKLNLKPAMSLKSVISQIKHIDKDAYVSYSRTFKSESEMKIATIPVGYADGYIRTLAQDGYVQIGDNKAKIIGRICMDQMVIDVTNCDDINIGQEVILFNGEKTKAPSVDEVASWGNTINYEIVCLVGKRVARVYIKNDNILYTSTLINRM